MSLRETVRVERIKETMLENVFQVTFTTLRKTGENKLPLWQNTANTQILLMFFSPIFDKDVSCLDNGASSLTTLKQNYSHSVSLQHNNLFYRIITFTLHTNKCKHIKGLPSPHIQNSD